MTNISRDKEVWGDNALVNGQGLGSVLIPQLGDGCETPKLPSVNVIFLLQNKSLYRLAPMSLMLRQIMLCVEESSSGQRYLKICFQIWTHSSSHIPSCYRMSLANGIPASVVCPSVFVTGLCSPSTHMISCSNCFSFQRDLPVFPRGFFVPTFKA